MAKEEKIKSERTERTSISGMATLPYTSNEVFVAPSLFKKKAELEKLK